MNKNNELRKNIIERAMIDFPDISSKALANYIYCKGDNNKLFTCPETIRKRISKLRNQTGEYKKRVEFKEQKKLIMNKSEIIKGIRSKRKPYILPKSQSTVLIISDFHIPYHSENEIKLALEYGKKNKVDTVIINGDYLDFYEVSRFQIDPRECDLKSAIEKGKSILQYIRKKFPKALILFKGGNHDRRLEDKLINKAPELLGLNFWRMEDLLGLKELNIQYIEDLDYIMIGNLKVIHGHEVKAGFIAPVNPARGLFMRVKESCLQSHVHRTSEHTEKTLGGKLIGTWSIGCLSDLNPDYNPYNNYNHGFAVVKVDSKGNFTVFNKKIIDGKIV